jgi:magnesium-transporting ATPase (P-type)
MNDKNWREKGFIFGIIAAITYIILPLIAMVFYAGGTMVNPNAPGYTFWENFFSDLGMTKSYSGKDNTVSMIIFIIAWSVWGISIIITALGSPYFFRENSMEKWLSIIGSFFLIITGISIVGVAFTPWDIYYDEHLVFDELTGLFSGIGSILYIFVALHNKDFPNRFTYTWAVMIAAGVITLVINNLFGVWPPTTTEELMLFTVGQKIRTYIFSACVFYLNYVLWEQIKS